MITQFTSVCVLPILTRSLKSVLLAWSAPWSFLSPGNRHSCTSIAAAICIAVGNVSLELCNQREKYCYENIKELFLLVTVIMKKILRHNTVNNHKATQIPAFLSSLSLLPPPSHCKVRWNHGNILEGKPLDESRHWERYVAPHDLWKLCTLTSFYMTGDRCWF